MYVEVAGPGVTLLAALRVLAGGELMACTRIDDKKGIWV